jgi:hypothetical protein
MDKLCAHGPIEETPRVQTRFAPDHSGEYRKVLAHLENKSFAILVSDVMTPDFEHAQPIERPLPHLPE